MGGKAKKKGKGDEAPFEDVIANVKGAARDVWLAGLGALGTVEAEGGKFFKKLVHDGKKVEKRLDVNLDKIRERAEEVVGGAGDKAREGKERLAQFGQIVEQSVSATLEKIGVRTRQEVENLQDEIERLKDRLSGLEEKKPAARKKATSKKTARKKASKKAARKKAARKRKASRKKSR